MIKSEKLAQALATLRQLGPLVVNITNDVVTNLTANALLALGASPAMSAEAVDAAQLTGFAKALVINMGTPSVQSMPVMFAAAEAAAQAKTPMVMDPVACGVTDTRRELAAKLLASKALVAVRGNASEIMALAGFEAASKGVDSLHKVADAQCAAQSLAEQRGIVVSVSGELDFVVAPNKFFSVRGGSAIATKVTGMGCTATAVLGAYLAVCHDPADAALAACCTMKLCAQKAQAIDPQMGSGSFQVHFLDALYQITPHELAVFCQDNAISQTR